MSLDDLPANTPQRRNRAEAVVRRVDRASPSAEKITRAEELRLQLADEIVRGALRRRARRWTKPTSRGASACRARRCAKRCASLSPPAWSRRAPHRGAVVARPSIERLTGMFEAMAELEALCAGLAAERMTPVERHRLEAVHEELRVLSYAGNPDRFHEVNERFHNTIYAGSQNAYIAEMTLATRVRVQPFRRAQFRNLGRLAKSHAEHDRVVVAIMRGDKHRRRRPPCAPISSWCATSTRSTRCRCRLAYHLRVIPASPGANPECRLAESAISHSELACFAAPRNDGARTHTAAALRHIRAPAAERRDVARAAERRGLDDEALDAAAVGQTDRADRQRRRHRGDELAEGRRRQRPDFKLDRTLPVPASTRSMPGFGGVVSRA